jgi:hypothetical protein
MIKLGSMVLAIAGSSFLTGCAAQRDAGTWPTHTLRATQTTLLTPPQGRQFDASGLVIMPDGNLLTVGNTHGPVPHRIDFQPGLAEARLVPLTNYFTSNAVATATDGGRAVDCEGLALDAAGWLYECEERGRWILRGNAAGRVERLPIDWSPVKHYFSSIEPNASFEGVAVGGGHIYIANERTSPVIIVVDAGTGKVTHDEVVQPSKSSLLGLHYSDLCWFEDRLWILCRQHYVILEVDPRSWRVVAEYNYREVEDRLGYATGLPVGTMEGLAVERDFFWLVTDNNGNARRGASHDRRPTLVKCPRPGRP